MPRPDLEPKVEGKRSPRWAFMSRMSIPCSDGLIYLVRLRILDTPWFGIYLHDVHEPDHDYDPHDHPWPFLSIILRGGYIERVYPQPTQLVVGGVGFAHKPPLVRVLPWTRWSVHKMGMVEAHRITHVEPRTVSLILRGKRRETWGFWTPYGWVDWRDYKKVH